MVLIARHLSCTITFPSEHSTKQTQAVLCCAYAKIPAYLDFTKGETLQHFHKLQYLNDHLFKHG